MDRTKDDIWHLARYFGIHNQVEIHENVSPEQVNIHLNRSRVNLIWSRREGVNRAIIEGMFTGVPCLVRCGFNYDFKYPYINANTGRYSSERDLPRNLVWMIENYERFDPRSWVMARMTCPKSTEILNEAIRSAALAAGERWTCDLAVKSAGLGSLKYFDTSDSLRFESDYIWLRSVIKSGEA
jgi:hypothetical protein